MAHHASALKRVRSNETKRLRNRHKKVACRKEIKQFMVIQSQGQALEALPSLFSSLDKLAKSNVLHRNKSARLKSKLSRIARQLAV